MGIVWTAGCRAVGGVGEVAFRPPASAAATVGAPKMMKQPRIVLAARRASIRPCRNAKPIAAMAMTAMAVATVPVSMAAAH